MTKKPVLVPRHNPFVKLAPEYPGARLYAVRRAHAIVGSGSVLRNVRDYTNRETWYKVAEDLAQQYFPRSLKAENTQVMEMVTWLYLYALVLYPRQYRLKGIYKPDWTRGTLLSWFRRSAGPHTRQWWATQVRLDEPAGIEQAVSNGQAYLGIEDNDWLSEVMTFLSDQAAENGRRGDLARLIYWPVALAHVDAGWRERTQYDALPQRRKVMRTQKQGTMGYVRRGREIWMLADRYAQQKLAELDWINLREGSLDVLDYRVSWAESKTGQGIHIQLQPGVADTLAARVKVILNGGGTAPYQLHRLNQVIEDFAHLHRYATGAGRQLWALDRWIFQQVRRTLMPHYPDAGKRLTWLRGKLYNHLVFPQLNPFLDPQKVSEGQWQALFSPYR